MTHSFFEVRVAHFALRVKRFGLRATGFVLRAARYGLRVSGVGFIAYIGFHVDPKFAIPDLGSPGVMVFQTTKVMGEKSNTPTLHYSGFQ